MPLYGPIKPILERDIKLFSPGSWLNRAQKQCLLQNKEITIKCKLLVFSIL